MMAQKSTVLNDLKKKNHAEQCAVMISAAYKVNSDLAEVKS